MFIPVLGLLSTPAPPPLQAAAGFPPLKPKSRSATPVATIPLWLSNLPHLLTVACKTLHDLALWCLSPSIWSLSSLSALQPHWPPCCSSCMPCFPSPWGLHRAPPPQTLLPRCPPGLLTQPPKFPVKLYLLRKAPPARPG